VRDEQFITAYQGVEVSAEEAFGKSQVKKGDNIKSLLVVIEQIPVVLSYAM
jgi:hypothetical protein